MPWVFDGAIGQRRTQVTVCQESQRRLHESVESAEDSETTSDVFNHVCVMHAVNHGKRRPNNRTSVPEAC